MDKLAGLGGHELELEPVEAELEPALERPRGPLLYERQAVVVGGCAPELQPRAVEDEARKDPLLDVERMSPAAPRPPRRPGQRELLGCDLVSRRRPFRLVAEEEAEGEEALVCVSGEIELDVERAAGRHEQAWQPAVLPRSAVDLELPLALVAVERGEVVAVADPEAPAAACLGLDRLREELQLVQRGMRRSVGPDDSVRAEVPVVRRLAEVAAVGPVLA